ncbi:MAG: 5'-nucleotidase, lipoprotein e(P4) family [Candidatus Acidiferrales bacterium]
MSRSTVFIAIPCSLFAASFAQPTAPPAYENLNAVLWMQTSVEYKASTVQAYRSAQGALLQGLHDPHWTAALEQNGDFENLPPAVILDLDETVLDNSGFEARLTALGESFSEAAWAKWENERSAGLVPGAMDFLQFAHAHGVAPIYITNRTCDPTEDDDPTVQLLRSLHVPFDPVSDRLLCAKDSKESDKTARRKISAAKFRILLQFGDQLGDFLQIPPASANLDGREKLFLAHQSMWGGRWFLLPNPTYGSWESAVGYSIPEKLKHLRQ